MFCYIFLHPEGFSEILGLQARVNANTVVLWSHWLGTILQFLDMRRDVQEIFRMTPHEKQVMMFSATLSKEIRLVCKKFMQDVNTHSYLHLSVLERLQSYIMSCHVVTKPVLTLVICSCSIICGSYCHLSCLLVWRNLSCHMGALVTIVRYPLWCWLLVWTPWVNGSGKGKEIYWEIEYRCSHLCHWLSLHSPWMLFATGWLFLSTAHDGEITTWRFIFGIDFLAEQRNARNFIQRSIHF